MLISSFFALCACHFWLQQHYFSPPFIQPWRNSGEIKLFHWRVSVNLLFSCLQTENSKTSIFILNSFKFYLIYWRCQIKCKQSRSDCGLREIKWDAYWKSRGIKDLLVGVFDCFEFEMKIQQNSIFDDKFIEFIFLLQQKKVNYNSKQTIFK